MHSMNLIVLIVNLLCLFSFGTVQSFDVPQWNTGRINAQKPSNLLKSGRPSFRQVTIGNTNPVCTFPYYEGLIQSNAAAGSFITRVSATDPNGLPITWSIPDTSLQRFTINPQTGDVFTSANMTRRFQRAVVEFLVRATNAAGLSCDSIVRVNIITVPQSQTIFQILNGSNTYLIPNFGGSQFYYTLTSCGNVGTLTATNNPDRYTIDGSNIPFSVDSNGVISISGVVYASSNTSFSIFASNAYGSATATVYVFSNVYCNGGQTSRTPAFSTNTYTFSLATCTSGTSVGSVSASNNPTSYGISGTSLFTMSQNGAISLAGTASPGTYSFVTSATNPIGTSYALVTVVATCGLTSNFSSGGTAAGAPVFGQSAYSVSLTNCQTGSTVGRVSAVNANSYAILSANSSYGIQFDGTITVVNPPTSGQTQTITIQALNNLGSAFTSVSITANCNYNNFGSYTSANSAFGSGSYSFNINNCSPGQPVGAVSAVYGSLYSIASGGSGFSINQLNGQITTTSTIPSGSSSFLIQASGSNGNSYATVTVNSNCGGAVVSAPTVLSSTGPPVFQTSNFVFNSSCAPGALIGTAVAGGVSPAFSIASGGTGFQINSQTGQITLSGTAPVQTVQAFLIQAVNTLGTAYATVTVNCGGGGSGAAGVFSQPSYIFYPVSCGSGVIVGQVIAGGQNVSYSSNGLPYWNVDPVSGIITSATTVPNFSTFAVTAISGGQTATVTVTTSSNCPDYFSYTVTQCEAGSVMVPARAISALSSGQVTSFSLSPPTDMFVFDANTGQVVTRGALRSGTYSYSITARLRDGRTYTAMITLVVNCGGTSVQFSQPAYNFAVPCSRLPTRVGVVRASASSGDSINYSLGATNALFFIDTSSGEIMTQVATTRSSRQTFSVTALSASGAIATAVVNVQITC